MLVIDRNTVICGDCVDVLAALGEASVDAIVTDPPYGLGSREPTVDELVEFLRGERHIDTGGDFMGKQWQVPSVAAWKECWRVLKPGGHLLAFGGTRTFDLISLGLRAAGFEYRDTLQWLYGQGFPKSLDVSKAIDKETGLERRVVGTKLGQPGYSLSDGVAGTSLSGSADGSLRDGRKECEVTEPASEEAKIWQGWGTALKPAWEPILMFRKPLTGTVAENVLEHGTGAINVDASRVATAESITTHSRGDNTAFPKRATEKTGSESGRMEFGEPSPDKRTGRWPPNVILSHSRECVKSGKTEVKGITGGTTVVRRGGLTTGDDRTPSAAGRFAAKQQPDRKGYSDEDGLETIDFWECAPGCPVLALNEQAGLTTSGALTPQHRRSSAKGWSGPFADDIGGPAARSVFDSNDGYVSRFFPQLQDDRQESFFYEGKVTRAEATLDGRIENKHPTKKPVALMRWLVRLVCRKGGLVIDPYCGSGSTLVAALEEEMEFLGVDQDKVSVELARSRISVRRAQGVQTKLF